MIITLEQGEAAGMQLSQADRLVVIKACGIAVGHFGIHHTVQTAFNDLKARGFTDSVIQYALQRGGYTMAEVMQVYPQEAAATTAITASNAIQQEATRTYQAVSARVSKFIPGFSPLLLVAGAGLVGLFVIEWRNRARE